MQMNEPAMLASLLINPASTYERIVAQIAAFLVNECGQPTIKLLAAICYGAARLSAWLVG